MNGTKVIVRGEKSGVFAGTLNRKDGREVELKNCRRLWYWDGACSDFELAKSGVSKQENCKFTVEVDSICILDAIEVLPMTEKAVKSIWEVEEWKSERY